MKWFRRIVTGLLALAVLSYCGTTAYVYAKQGQIIYLPTRNVDRTPRDFGFNYEELRLPVKRATGVTEQIAAWWIPAPESNGASELFLHGNSRNMAIDLPKLSVLVNAGFNVLVIDYRGYGKSDGDAPYEAALYEDARAALDELKRREPDSRKRLIHGHSLGGAVAIDLAMHRPEAAALLVEATFDNMLGMSTVRAAYRLLPIDMILTERFDSIDKVTQIRMPVLYMHGTSDLLIPQAMSERLYTATPEGRKQLLLLENGTHGNLHTFQQYAPAIRALMHLGAST